MATQLPTQKAMPISFGVKIPDSENARAFQIIFDFTATSAASQTISVNGRDYGVSTVQTMFIDNSNSPSATTFTVTGTNQKVTCPPNTQGFFPVMFLNDTITLTAVSAGLVAVPVQFINIFIDMMLWAVGTPGAVVGAVTVSGTVSAAPVIGAYTNRSGSLAVAGTSQQLCAANGARKRLFIQNPSTLTGQNIAAAENLYINFTNAAGVQDGVSIELLPGQAFDTGMGPVTSELITVNAATAGHRYIAREM